MKVGVVPVATAVMMHLPALDGMIAMVLEFTWPTIEHIAMELLATEYENPPGPVAVGPGIFTAVADADTDKLTGHAITRLAEVTVKVTLFDLDVPKIPEPPMRAWTVQLPGAKNCNVGCAEVPARPQSAVPASTI